MEEENERQRFENTMPIKNTKRRQVREWLRILQSLRRKIKDNEIAGIKSRLRYSCGRKRKHFRFLQQTLNDKTYQYYLSFERVHLGNFLLGSQSYQCWTGPEMIAPPSVLTVKNQGMVYNPKGIKNSKHTKSLCGDNTITSYN